MLTFYKPLMRCAALTLSIIWTTPTMATEEPSYRVLRSEPPFELRDYDPMIIAQTRVSGDMDQASSKGFRIIADYIFGNNQTPENTSDKIAMTAPVTVTPQSTTIAMTAPVNVAPLVNSMQEANEWLVSFVMPRQDTLQTIPKPTQRAVTLIELPRRYFVVNQFSGFNNISKIQDKTEQTIQWATQQGYTLKGPPELARYNPPWTLPMFRRNEIMIEVGKPD